MNKLKEIFKKNLRKVFLFLFLPLIFFGLYGLVLAANSILSVEIDPALDITNFAPYRIYSEISGSPSSVSVEVSGVNGDGGAYWNYFVDGTPDGSPRTKTMSYDNVSGKWRSQAIYPDDIYPEIYFADSDITWYNEPSEMNTWRRNYHILKFANPFSMVADMNFFIEFNVAPASLNNSSDLSVYLVAKDQDINTYFNDDWRSKDRTELVGTINRNQAYHHQHTANSTHYLVALSTNGDGTIGSKNLNISDNFYVVLYQDSTNTNRGWNLRYHQAPLCENTANWYVADRSGGNTWNQPVHQNGCPDTHIHIARRAPISDGVKAVVTADFGGGDIQTMEETFSFAGLPNLAPNPTSFISPAVGGTYDGGINEEINVSWNPATDPNNDPLLYSVYLLDSSDQVLETLILSTSSTSFIWDIQNLDDGEYKLKGVITEDIVDDPLSTEFFMSGTFIINKAVPLYDLSSITILSNNAVSYLAKAGDVVTLDFSATGILAEDPVVEIYSGGVLVSSTVTVSDLGSNNWRAQYTVSGADTSGSISFEISASNLSQIYSETTDESNVEVDVISPSSIVASPMAGTYSSPQNVSLSSSGSSFIKYTTNGVDPTCSSGTSYVGAISVSAPTTIKAIACDLAGNSSAIATLNYAFSYTVTFNGNGGTGHTPTSILVSHGATTTLPTEPTRTGYTFQNWNTTENGSGDIFNTSSVVTQNIIVYAQWSLNNYTLTYYSNGSDGGDVYGSENYDHGQTATLKDENTATKTGYNFYAWNTEADGSGDSYATGTEVVMIGDLDLYAQWLEDAKCTVVFNGNGGSGYTPSSHTVTCGNSLQDEAKNLPTGISRSGYSFVNWNTALNGSGDIFSTTTVISVDPTVVYAQWLANTYTITFNAQTGTVSPSDKEVTYQAQVGELPTPSKANYDFVSWNSLADGSGTVYSTSLVYSVVGNITLYAQYVGSNYSLIFSAQGGSVSPADKTVVYGNAIGSLPTPTKAGYTFSGWNTEIDGSGDTYTQDTVFLAGDSVILYAQYVGNTYSISFNSAGGSLVNSKSVTFNSTIGSLQTPTKEGYIFNGWYTEPYGDGVLYTSNTVYNTVGNLLLVAYWTEVPVTYTLSYSAQAGGSLSGSLSQTVEQGQNGSVITANPSAGYRFVRWSDNSTTNPRVDSSVSSNINVSAIFEIIPSSASQLSLPGSVGAGQREASVSVGSTIGGQLEVGEINNSGVNVLTYITNKNNFLAPQSSNNWNLASHRFVISELDLYKNIITIIISSQPQTLVLAEGQSRQVDLDGDGIKDILVTFTDVYINRAEITIKSLAGSSVILPETDTSGVIKITNDKVYSNLKGKILLKVEDNGRAYYVSPVKKEMYYLGRPADAFTIMRQQGFGITNSDLDKILINGEKSNSKISSAFSKKHLGKIFVQVEKNGEAWYVNPVNSSRYYLGRPADAFRIMRELSLGISNVDFTKLSQ
jgi:uncharacterized repeat protein (TIGR02543 family)